MGIDGLLAAMKPEMKFGHLSNFTGKVAAIDAMSWLYKGAFSCAMELAQKKPVATYLLFTYKMIMLLKKWQVKPIFCIDGRTLGAKERTNRKRTERKHTETDKA
jgi:exonuclease-1